MVIGALGKIPKGLIKGIEDLEIRRRVLFYDRPKSLGDLRSQKSSEKNPSANACVKNPEGRIMNESLLCGVRRKSGQYNFN